jgi:hypothetical protein
MMSAETLTMPRTVQITSRPTQSDRLMARVRTLDGLVGLRFQRGAVCLVIRWPSLRFETGGVSWSTAGRH